MRVTVAVALAVALAGALAACDAPELGPPPGGVDTLADPVENAPNDAAAARTEDNVQVIVRLRFEAPAGAAPDSEAYKTAVAAAREKFLRSIAGIPHRVVRDYDTLPLVVLSLPKAQRAEVERSPLVASVEDDRLNAPLAQ